MTAMTKKTSPYGSGKFLSIDDYHASVDTSVRELLEKLREAIRKAAPDADEVISYNMPAFKQGSVLVYYMAHARHIGFYPTPSPLIAFKKELLPYQTSKGGIQFPLDKPLPLPLIKKIVKYRVREVQEWMESKKKKSTGRE